MRRYLLPITLTMVVATALSACAAGTAEVAVSPSATTSADTPVDTTVSPPVAADGTLDAPVTVDLDGDHHAVVAAPEGWSAAPVHHLVVALPGHGSTAEQDAAAWRPHLDGGQWAVASIGWWDGEGETIEDYLSPPDVVTVVHALLPRLGLDADDVVVLSGFSRGSANTYAVTYQDGLTGAPVFDAVISASGKFQPDFPLGAPPGVDPLADDGLFEDMPWVLACGGQDPTPDRDGCPGMHETEEFLTAHGADVLAVLEDPDADHGAFHRSPLDLPEQAFALITAVTG